VYVTDVTKRSIHYGMTGLSNKMLQSQPPGGIQNACRNGAGVVVWLGDRRLVLEG
jgi:hypothetical protein